MELLFLIVGVAALVWGMVFLRLAGLWGCILLLLIAGTVFGHSFFHISVVTSDRLLLLVCLSLLVVYRYLGLTEKVGWHWVDTALVVFTGLLMLSTVSHDWRVDEGWPISKLVFCFLLPVGLYWLSRSVSITPNRLRWMFVTLTVLAVYLGITAVAEKNGMAWAVYPRYISNPQYAEFLGRGRGPLLNPVGNGILMTLGMSCALMLLPRASRVGQVAIAVSVLICLAGISCTLTRSVWIGGGLALIGILWVSLPKRMRMSFAMVVMLGGGLYLASKSERLVGFKRDKNVSVADMKQSAQLRPILAAFAWEMFQERPLLGCGTGQYLQNAANCLSERKVDLPMEKAKTYVQHNVFLALLVENGIIGLTPFLAFLAWSVVQASRLWQTERLESEYRQMGLVFLAFMAAYLVNGMFHDLSIITMMNAYLFFNVGVIRNLASKHAMVFQASPWAARWCQSFPVGRSPAFPCRRTIRSEMPSS